MPAAPRRKGLGKKIAYAILGKPANIVNDKTPYSKKVDRELTYQETSRAK